jgi:hypothetical protein
MPKYKQLACCTDLCEVAIEECLLSFKNIHRIYTLYVGRGSWYTATRLRAIWYPSWNPLAPVLNIELEPMFTNHEWCLAAEGEEFRGSGV